MTTPTAQRAVAGRTLDRVVPIALFLWLCARISLALIDISVNDRSVLLDATTNGSLRTQAQVLAFALIGALKFRAAIRNLRLTGGRWVSIPLGMYLAWAIASVLWSIDRGLTIRRDSELVLVLLGCFGLGAGYYAAPGRGPKALARHLLYGGITASLAVVSYALVNGIIALMPNLRGSSWELIWCAMYGIVALVYLYYRRPWRAFAYAIPLAACIFVFRPRAATLFTALTCVAMILVARRRLMSGLAAGSAVLITVIVCASVDISNGNLGYLLSRVVPAGENESARTLDSLDGRLPLWSALVPYAEENIWHGYGFGAFWESNHLQALWNVVGWTAPVAHNGFIDETLGTGVIGLSLLLTGWLAAMRRAALLMKEGRGSALFILAVMMLTLLINSTDTIFQFPIRFPFLAAMVGLGCLMTREFAQGTRAPQQGIGRFRQARGLQPTSPTSAFCEYPRHPIDTL